MLWNLFGCTIFLVERMRRRISFVHIPKNGLLHFMTTHHGWQQKHQWERNCRLSTKTLTFSLCFIFDENFMPSEFYIKNLKNLFACRFDKLDKNTIWLSGEESKNEKKIPSNFTALLETFNIRSIREKLWDVAGLMKNKKLFWVLRSSMI